MKLSLTIFSILFIGVSALHAQQTYTLDSTIVTSRTVKDSLDIPWEIIWGPDDYIWVTERYGRVSRINPVTGEQNVLLNISSDVYEKSEAGMLGMVLHPDFTNNPHVFVAYTYLSGSNIRERLVKFNYNGTNLIPLDTLIEDIIGGNTHIGSRLIILPDTTLLMTTGDAQRTGLTQDTNSLAGKVLRMNLDGSIPSDNPNSNSYIWSIGHRNAQGLWLAPNGVLYSSEHGPQNDDELNIIYKDRNYGWPDVEGFCDSPPELAYCSANNIVEPLAAWTPTIAPSDIIWYDHPAIPELKDKLLLTLLKDKSLIVFEFNTAGDSVVSEKKYFKDDFGRLRDICIAPSGKIYLATNGDSWSNTDPFTHSIIELSNDSFVTAIENIEDLENIKIGPNPLVKGQDLYVSLPDGEKGEFVLFDLLSRSILRQNIEGIKNDIILPVAEGIYVWKIILANSAYKEGKLIIN